MKFLDDLAVKLLQRKQKKQVKKALSEQSEEAKRVYKNLKDLYSFVAWLNKTGLKNRKEKKAFWASVRHGEPVLEKYINSLIERYKIQIKINESNMKALKEAGKKKVKVAPKKEEK